jgi:DNA-binding transcriptional regulator YdaS (Cro superfamily)
MRKINAIKAFGSAAALARAIGIAPQAVYQWPEHLSPKVADRVVAAAMRSGINPDIFGPLPPI